jgi:hypothetical protein
MKNIKRLFVAAVALVSASSMASLMQPTVPVSEDAPFRISGGLHSGLVKNDNGMGANDLGAAIGFTHNVGYDFEYGASIGGGWAAPNVSRLFTKDVDIAGKKTHGARMDVELMARFMPELADKFHVGGLLGIGWGHQFGEFAKAQHENIAFGDLAFKAGIPLSYGFTDMVSMYFAPAYTLTNIRFVKGSASDDVKKSIKDVSNTSGFELPLGVWFGVSDSTGLFVEANTRNVDVSNAGKITSWREEVTLGVSFAL